MSDQVPVVDRHGCEHCLAYGELYSAARDVLSSTNGGLLPPTLSSLERLQRFFRVRSSDDTRTAEA